MQYRYEPYGKLTAFEDEWGTPFDPDDWSIDVFNLHQFQGMYYDRETGFYYARARYYLPEEGRFDAEDPNGQALIPAVSTHHNRAIASKSPGRVFAIGISP